VVRGHPSLIAAGLAAEIWLTVLNVNSRSHAHGMGHRRGRPAAILFGARQAGRNAERVEAMRQTLEVQRDQLKAEARPRASMPCKRTCSPAMTMVSPSITRAVPPTPLAQGRQC
jgi:hypothetical protein